MEYKRSDIVAGEIEFYVTLNWLNVILKMQISCCRRGCLSKIIIVIVGHSMLRSFVAAVFASVLFFVFRFFSPPRFRFSGIHRKTFV